ncbi:DoxX family protein [Streptomyces corynorhini]|uniref:DoxX family protein n=1 Tax=Streptomyces corynorhini TaxID=2282652 RepID=UPI001F349F79|nr:DoxX family protein [Streptomyces corynorhini]
MGLPPPGSRLPALAALKAPGVAGLVVGLVVGLLGGRAAGVAAATCLVLFSTGATAAHFRARAFPDIAFPGACIAPRSPLPYASSPGDGESVPVLLAPPWPSTARARRPQDIGRRRRATHGKVNLDANRCRPQSLPGIRAVRVPRA